MNTIRNINTTNLSSKELLEGIVHEYVRISDLIQYKFYKNINITKHFKAWWNEKYRVNLDKYQSSKITEDWKNFKGVIKKTKCLFFDKKIQEIMSKNKRLWDFMNYVKKHCLLAIEALQHNVHSCVKIEDNLTQHKIVKSTSNCQMKFLQKIDWNGPSF